MRILIVEDEKDISRFLKAGFTAESFVADIAEDGEQGSYLARTNDYDLIILDNMLPLKTGRQVCEDIRKAKISTPILMLSVKSETTMKVDLLNAGADDYLTKPFSLDELLARSRALLRRPEKIIDQVFTAHGLTVDIAKQVVSRDNQEIYLTRKEFMLLEYLLRNRGTVVSRGMILEHVWDMSVDPFSNTIEAHIMSLRKKIDTKTVKLIQTVSGRGYKITV